MTLRKENVKNYILLLILFKILSFRKNLLYYLLFIEPVNQEVPEPNIDESVSQSQSTQVNQVN